MTVPLSTGNASGVKQTQSFSVQIPSAGAGSHTFKLWVRNATNGLWSGYQRNLYVKELKRSL